MKKTILPSILAAVLASAANASAGLVGVSELRIYSAVPSWLQVSEVAAIQSGTGLDLADASAGATATGTGDYPGTSPAYAIDGVGPSSHPLQYHSNSAAGTEYLNIKLAFPAELDTVTIYGRTDCCWTRDVYDLELYSASGSLLAKYEDLDAGDTSYLVSVKLPDTTGVPDGGGMSLVGLSLGALALFRRLRPS